ncbi:MAG: ATP-dependent DNA helicase RecG [Parcubacteria group bacterium]
MKPFKIFAKIKVVAVDELKISTPLKSIKGVPPGTAKKLEEIGIKTAGDLLLSFPVRYEDWINPETPGKFSIGENIVVRARVNKSFTKRIWQRKLSITEAELQGENGVKIKAVWFNQPYVRYGFGDGDEIVASGKIMERQRGLVLWNPVYEVVGKENSKSASRIGSIIPVYIRPKGVSSAMMQRIAGKIISLADSFTEFIPEKIRLAEQLPEISVCIRKAHFPENMKDGAFARKRFSFETLFLIQLLNRVSRQKLMEMKAPVIPFDAEEIKQMLSLLPYELTFSQKKSLFQILSDMSSGHPMNRLLQGDVGSGKTVVAAIAAIVAAKRGYQSAIMAPTEILAVQHYETIKKLFSLSGITLGLFTSGEAKVFMEECLESDVKKSEMADMLSRKKINIVVGTHALIAKRQTGPVLDPESLGLVVVDEQHRFGVSERAHLAKGNAGTLPHFLSMSATPIPRTMAIALFGDLDMSFIDELPKGRKKIVTKWVSPQNRNKAYAFIRSELAKGRQAFVICPKIETREINNEEINPVFRASWDNVKNVKEEYDRLSSHVFPGEKIGMLHGKMPAKEKEKIMGAFKKGDLSVLVCTSVVEVGIDVPNASIMVIEDADRFGLAQLYQFKGRVGRGEHQSYCLLFSAASTDIAKNRLTALSEAKNGLELAEKDLALRGPGEFLGNSQKGLPDITMKALENKELVKRSREAVDIIMESGLRLQEFAPLKSKLDSLREQFHLE